MTNLSVTPERSSKAWWVNELARMVEPDHDARLYAYQRDLVLRVRSMSAFALSLFLRPLRIRG